MSSKTEALLCEQNSVTLSRKHIVGQFYNENCFNEAEKWKTP